jgi:bifunctional DNA-binding transcriptional regulator/antitoxin component of YhaV-PrlF toxin-antitoxin module
MAQVAKISSKGQLVIPAELRKKYRLLPHTRAVFGESNGKLTVESSALSEVLALRGCLSHVKEDIEGLMMEERRLDRARDERKFAEPS